MGRVTGSAGSRSASRPRRALGSNVSAISKRVAGSLPHQPARRGAGGVGRQPLVQEQLGDRARAAVEVLVGAPGRGVDVGIVERQGHVPGRVGEVPQRDRAGVVDRGRESGDVVRLARRVVHAGQQGQRQPVAVLADGRLEVVGRGRATRPSRGRTTMRSLAGSRPRNRSCDSTAYRSDGNVGASMRIARPTPAAGRTSPAGGAG